MRSIIITVALIYLLLMALIFVFQRRMQYFPTHQDQRGDGVPPFTPWQINGQFLGYIYEHHPVAATYIFFHGNAGEAIHRSWIIELIGSQNVAIVLAEYPGYGARPGQPTQKSILSEALAVYDHAKLRWTSPIVAIGESIGASVACYLASQRLVDRLLLLAPFNSAVAVAKSAYPFLPVSMLMKDQFDSESFLRTVDRPLHIIHGTSDSIIPIDLARSLFNNYQGATKTMTELEGVDHNNLVEPLLHSAEAEEFRRLVRGT